MNPRHHLHESTLMSYAAGGLQAPLSIVAGAHLEQCPHCRQRLRDAEAVGSALLEQTQPVLDDTRRETLRAAMLAQLMDRRVIISVYLIGKWQVAGVEYARLGTEEVQKTRCRKFANCGRILCCVTYICRA